MKVMKWSVIALAVAAGTSQMALASQQSESKGFVEDASLDLLLRNTYYNRDYKDGADDVRSWGQGLAVAGSECNTVIELKREHHAASPRLLASLRPSPRSGI